MKFKIDYHHLVVAVDIPNIPEVWRKKVRLAIETKLTTHPDLYGKPLRRSIAGYRKLRVGDYRIVFRIEGRTVKIMIIEHRSIVYKMIKRRI
jgi:mRNA interferase RelE/StbE